MKERKLVTLLRIDHKYRVSQKGEGAYCVSEHGHAKFKCWAGWLDAYSSFRTRPPFRRGSTVETRKEDLVVVIGEANSLAPCWVREMLWLPLHWDSFGYCVLLPKQCAFRKGLSIVVMPFLMYFESLKQHWIGEVGKAGQIDLVLHLIELTTWGSFTNLILRVWLDLC